MTELHPYNEWSAAHTRAAVGEIAELVRYLNHATQHPEAMPAAADVGETLRLLGQTVRRLPQVMKQATARLNSLGDDAPADLMSLADRLDSLGQEIERAGFAARGPAAGDGW